MSAPVDRLTPRQKDCLRLAYYRLRGGEIAAELDLSSETVKTYLKQARDLLGANTSTGAAQILARHEGVPPPPKRGHPSLVMPPLPEVHAPVAPEAGQAFRLTVGEEAASFDGSMPRGPIEPANGPGLQALAA